MHQNAIGAALYTTLTSTPGTATWGTRVYDRQGPQGAAHPMLIFSMVGGGDTNEAAKRIVDVLYDVQCIAEASNVARAGAAAIGTALHHAALSVTGYHTVAVTQGALIQFVENVDGRQYWHDGAEYRIRLEKTT